MRALITGSSSGMGREMAKYLASMGWDLILVARRRERLMELKESLPKEIDIKIITLDLSYPECAKSLYEHMKFEDIDMLINNAGFGLFGEFADTDLDKELQMINTNITAVHILTKLFLQKFVEEDKGRILNVASSAGFLAGPLLSSYYASKNYVVRLTEAIYEELRRNNSNVKISCFCPGPVNTEFNQVAGVRFAIDAIGEVEAAHYAIDRAFKNKLIIIPTASMKVVHFFSRFVPEKMLTRINYNVQRKKDN